MKTTRRDFIKTAVTAAAAGAFWPGRLRAEDAAVGENGAFTFLAANDLHFTEEKLCAPWFERAFKAMRASAPQAEFLIVSGDLTSEATTPEFGGLKEAFQSFGLPVYVVAGNHDVGHDGNRKEYDAHFPDRHHYAFEHRGWQFFGFNSAPNRGAEGTIIRPSALKWMDETLPRFNPDKPSVVFTHFPLAYGLRRRPVDADGVFKRFASFNVQAILNGHFHGYTEGIWRNSRITTNRCFSRYRDNMDGHGPKGWFVCEAREGRIHRRAVDLPE
ncbi:MAG: metallophosphoesterase [Kiritimatiellae bacterium]|nr:metallophosphoesterase [Kiritimatiellia bacterium]